MVYTKVSVLFVITNTNNLQKKVGDIAGVLPSKHVMNVIKKDYITVRKKNELLMPCMPIL